jgi:hypothetical protein
MTASLGREVQRNVSQLIGIAELAAPAQAQDAERQDVGELVEVGGAWRRGRAAASSHGWLLHGGSGGAGLHASIYRSRSGSSARRRIACDAKWCGQHSSTALGRSKCAGAPLQRILSVLHL